NPTGLLSGPAEGQPLDIARHYLTDHAAGFGLSPGDLTDSVVTSQYTDDDTGITHVYLRQRVNGLEVQYADIDVSLTSHGAVIAAGGGYVPGLTSKLTIAQQPPMSPVDAVTVAAAELGLRPEGPPVIVSQWRDAAQTTVLSAPGVSLDDITARLH